MTDERLTDPADVAEQAESLSMSFLVLLERLTPLERAVFLLHDVFAYDFKEIGRIVQRTPAGSTRYGRVDSSPRTARGSKPRKLSATSYSVDSWPRPKVAM